MSPERSTPTPEYPSTERAEQLINDDQSLFDLYEKAEHAAKGRQALEADFSENAFAKVGEAMKQKMTQEVKKLEDEVEEGLVSFQQDSPLSQEDKDAVIEFVINATVDDEEKNASTSSSSTELVKVHSDSDEEVLDAEIVDDGPEPKEDPEEDPIEDAVVVDDDSPTIKMPRIRRKPHRRRSPESSRERLRVREAKRQAIIERIDAADGIMDKKVRLEALTAIARQNMHTIERPAEFEDGKETVKEEYAYADLGIEAAKRIKQSKVHGPLRARKLGKVKELGKQIEPQDELLAELSAANEDNEVGIEAARAISRDWYRNEVLQARTVAAMSAAESSRLSPGDRAVQRALAEEARKHIRGPRSSDSRREVEIHEAKINVDPSYLASFGIRGYKKEQDAIYDIVASMTDIAQAEELAKKIKSPKKRREALDKVRERTSRK